MEHLVAEGIPNPKSILYKAASLFLVIASAQCATRAQSPQPTGTVEGRVVCEEGGFPARLTVVDLLPLERYLPQNAGTKPHSPDPAPTDLDGNFQFVHVQPGTYLVKVEKQGYSRTLSLALSNLDLFPAARRREILSQFPQVTVRSGGTSRVDVVIHRGAAISGHITFDSGGALSSVGEVTATLVKSDLFNDKDGDLTEKNGTPALFSDWTAPDDRGIYRFSGLPPGTYRLEVHLQELTRLSDVKNDNAGRGAAELRVFAPDVLVQDKSKLVEVAEGDELADVDITIPISSLHSVAGTVTERGGSSSKLFVTIHPSLAKWSEHETHGGMFTGVDGAYRFDLLPSGTYIIEVEETSPNTPASIVRARTTVVVGESDVLDANININTPAHPN